MVALTKTIANIIYKLRTEYLTTLEGTQERDIIWAREYIKELRKKDKQFNKKVDEDDLYLWLVSKMDKGEE